MSITPSNSSQPNSNQPSSTKPEINLSAEHHTNAAESCHKAGVAHTDAAKCHAKGDHEGAEEHADIAQEHCSEAQDHGKKAMAS